MYRYYDYYDYYDDGFLTGVYLTVIVICTIALIVAWAAAKVFEDIARDKGYTEKKYFWWCFWVWFVGYAMVIALPDRRARVIAQNTTPTPTYNANHHAKPKATVSDELPEL